MTKDQNYTSLHRLIVGPKIYSTHSWYTSLISLPFGRLWEGWQNRKAWPLCLLWDGFWLRWWHLGRLPRGGLGISGGPSWLMLVAFHTFHQNYFIWRSEYKDLRWDGASPTHFRWVPWATGSMMLSPRGHPRAWRNTSGSLAWFFCVDTQCGWQLRALICQLPVHVSVESRIGRCPFGGGHKQPTVMNAVRIGPLPLARPYNKR